MIKGRSHKNTGKTEVFAAFQGFLWHIFQAQPAQAAVGRGDKMPLTLSIYEDNVDPCINRRVPIQKFRANPIFLALAPPEEKR